MTRNTMTMTETETFDPESFDLQVGKSYILSVPPGWLIGGTVLALTATHVFLRDAAYLDGCAQDHAMFDLLLEKDPKKMPKICTRFFALPDGFGIRREAILLHGPSLHDFTPLSRAKQAAAIKNA